MSLTVHDLKTPFRKRFVALPISIASVVKGDISAFVEICVCSVDVTTLDPNMTGR